MTEDANGNAAPTELGGVRIEVSPGELIDKITILEIKARRIREPSRRANVGRELAALTAAAAALPRSQELNVLTNSLREVNETLWEIENDLRACEARGEFGPGFIALARAVYRTNDDRAELKRRINLLLRSRLIEEKSYADF